MSMDLDRSKRIATMAWAWTLIVLICSCRALASPPSHDNRLDRGPLLTWAHRISYVSEWSAMHSFWLSNDTILVFEPEWAKEWTPFELDVRTGGKRPLDALHRKNKPEGNELHGQETVLSSTVTLSPDRQWLMPSLPLQYHADWWALHLDGTKSVTGKLEDTVIDVGAWSAQSDAWITVTNEGDRAMVTRYSLETPDQPKQIRMPPLPRTASLPKLDDTVTHFLTDGPVPILGVTAQGHDILRARTYDPLSGMIDLFDVDLEAGKSPTHSWTVQLPNGAQFYDVVLSPQGDRLAWLLGFEKSGPGQAVNADLPARMEIWSSRLDGSGMQRLGYQPIHDAKQGHVYLSNLQWLPDGKHLSFVTHISFATALSEAGLYTIP
jgi:hypothetical protein